MQKENKTNPQWAMTPGDRFYRLLFIEPEKLKLSGVRGVVVLWHGGLKPEWIYVDTSLDIARDIDMFLDNEDIMFYDNRGGVFVSWALVREEYQGGVLKYLLDTMHPLLEHPKPPHKDTEPLPVLAPGEKACSPDS